MHSRIIGIITKDAYEKLYTEGERLALPNFEDMDRLPGWADYVHRDTDFEKDFEWLCSYLNNKYFNYDPQTKTIMFDEGYKKEFFKERYLRLRKKLNGPKGFLNFCSSAEAHNMRQLIKDEGGFIVSDENGCWEELDDFIREAKPNVGYVIFDSVDYHW